jgi:hypothetical protein
MTAEGASLHNGVYPSTGPSSMPSKVANPIHPDEQEKALQLDDPSVHIPQPVGTSSPIQQRHPIPANETTITASTSAASASATDGAIIEFKSTYLSSEVKRHDLAPKSLYLAIADLIYRH